MANADIQLLAWCNMLYDGAAFCVIQKPDFRGGHFHDIESYNYECNDFEYVAWSGTPSKFVQEKPSFSVHIEAFHEEPQDYEYSAYDMMKWEIEHRYAR